MTGKLYSGGGEVVIDKDGLMIDAPTADFPNGFNNIRWKRPDNEKIFSVGAIYTAAGFTQALISAHSTSGEASSMELSSSSPDGRSILLLTADSAGIDHSYIRLSDDESAAPSNRNIA